ncbi:PREDICTED: uncharacterized protein LOC109591962 [Amphimedon queenslandica]|uniref:Uncharacterized protein n=1 Tax=Amphimedon queenslandica TaxID=400682 RepID=A0AAN0K1R8_AMPQE|nr:PREDICTED: uncharacterized protein LOC109591962 [Amphimedon queenslandica]|eukprot:XP_019863107.1 PREDICTED: uncharacterized protein LOC109591962 [Amphimedon queenslandica]
MSFDKVVTIRHDLKVTSFIFDALNSFVTQAVLADSDINNTTGLNGTTSNDDRKKNETIVLSVFGSLYFIASLMHFIIFVVYCPLRDQSWTCDTSRDGIINRVKDEICYVYRKCKNFKVIVMLIINFLLLLSTWSCFVGDNLHSFGTLTENTRITSIVMLFAGLTGYRLIPLIKEKVKDLHEEYRNDDQNNDNQNSINHQNNDENQNNNCCIPVCCLNKMRKLNWKLFYATIDILHLVPEIDGWFTNFTALVALTNDEACPKKYNAAFWIMYALVLAVTASLPVIAVINLYCFCKKNAQQDDTATQQSNPENAQQENPENTQQDNLRNKQQKCQKKLNTIYLTILSFIMLFITALFLIGDNTQPLDCSKDDMLVKNKLRFSFVLVALFVYALMLILSPVIRYCDCCMSSTIVPLTGETRETTPSTN